MFIAINNSFWRFVIVWLAYSATNYRVIREASQPKLDPKTPRFVYRFYRGLFNATMGIAAFGYGLFLVNVFVFPTATLIDLSVTLVFYGLYFGVLSRDLVEYGADRMATTIGVYLCILLIPLSITAKKAFLQNTCRPTYAPSAGTVSVVC
jgi:RING finger protein 121